MGRLEYGKPCNITQPILSRIRGRNDWMLYINDYYWALVMDGYYEFYYNPRFYMGKIAVSDIPWRAVDRMNASCRRFTSEVWKQRQEEREPIRSSSMKSIPQWSDEKLRIGNVFYAMGAWYLTVDKMLYCEDPYDGCVYEFTLWEIPWRFVENMLTMSTSTITHRYLKGIGRLNCFRGMDISRIVRDQPEQFTEIR